MNKKTSIISPNKITIQEIRKISLTALDEIHFFCVNHNLKYTLFHGSLLGAVRHGGFIPWDDDMDIAMPRKDYEYFINNFVSKKCRVFSCETDKKYYLPWAKVSDNNTIKIEHIVDTGCLLGVNIDIYPVDTVSKESEVIKIVKKRLKYERYREYSLCIYTNPIKKLFSYFFRGKSNKYSCKINSINQLYSYKKACYYVTSEVYNAKPILFSLDMFDNLLLMDFEDRKYYISKNYDELLSKRLGDYKTLPPVNERKPHHDYEAYNKEEYDNYE